MNKKFPKSGSRDFVLANHARAAAWARESLTSAMVAHFTGGNYKRHLNHARWSASVARFWWDRFLAA